MAEKERPLCGRFAPSPSGRMHVGNMVSCLLSWLSVRSQGGRYVLRIEDLDPDRCTRERADQVEDDMSWLGLDWDEGGSMGGPNGPYYQSQRSEIYESYFEKLREQGLLYPCYCTRAELHAASAPHLSDGRVIYSGACRELTEEQRAEKSARRRPAVRIRVPAETISFEDGGYGHYEERLDQECGDFILRRSDGVYAYQLAVTVDDALMGITQVVRGRDLLDSTPRQIWLHQLLGFEPPEYHHVPLLVAKDGRRLSKRDGDLDMGKLRQRRTAKELVGAMAYCAGLLDQPLPVSPQELVSLFSWDKVTKEDILLPPGLF